MARWLSSPTYSGGAEMPVNVRGGVSVVMLEEGTWTNLEPTYQTVMLVESDAFLWIATMWTKVSLTRLAPSLLDLEFRGTVEARGWVYLSKEKENAMIIEFVLGLFPYKLFKEAEREVVWAACQRVEMVMEAIDVRVELRDRANVRKSFRTLRCVMPPFMVDAVFGTRSRLVRICKSMASMGLYQGARQDFFHLSAEKGSFEGNWAKELATMLNHLSTNDLFVPSNVHWRIMYRNVLIGETFMEGVHDLWYEEDEDDSDEEEGEKMASEEEAGNLRSTERGVERNEGSIRDRESANPEGTKEDGKDLSTGESSGKAGGSKRGSQENKEGRDKERSSPRNSYGIIVEKAKVSDARRKLEEIEKRTAEYKARLIEEMTVGNERDLPGEELREERRTSQGEIRHEGKDSSHRGTPSKKGKEKGDSPVVEAEKATNPPAIDSGANRLPAARKIMKGCDGLWGLRERVLGWFDPEGTTTIREKRKDNKEGEGTSTAGEGGLKKIVSTLTLTLNKNQGYLADAKKKLTFDGANITKFLIDYENLAALLKWSEEEKMDHLGQHVPLSLERDIMAIVAASRSWKATRNEMMRKYLKAEKMATEAELAAVQRNHYATYNDFLRAFTLRVEIEEVPEPQEQETEEAEAPQGVANLQRIPGDLEDLEKTFADIRLSLPDREGGGVMRAPAGTRLSFHALPVGKLKVQIGTHHTDALVDGGAEITLIRRDFATITGCMVNKEVTGSIRGAGGEIPFAGYVTKCEVKAGIRESIWSFQRMTVMEEMDHDIILGRPWCANVEMIGMHLHDDTYMVDIEDPVTDQGEFLRLLGTGGDPPKGKLATWSPTFEDSARKRAFARMEGMRERVEIMIEEAFRKKEWIKMGLPLKKRRQKDKVLEVMVTEKEPEVELGASLQQAEGGSKGNAGGLRNRADGLSRICFTSEGIEDVEPIDAFLEYEGGILVADNVMMSLACTPGQLLIQTLEKGAPAVVAELREGLVTTTRRKDEKDLWGATVGPKEELMAMVVKGAGTPYILDARDNLSGYVETVALKRKTGKGVADWKEDFYLRHPFIRRFIADNGTQFVNQEVLGKLKMLCVPIKIIEPYHPEANAPVERGHQTLKNIIAKLAADDLGNWPRYLKHAVFSENMTPKRTMRSILAELWYGREIDFPVEALVPTWNRIDDNPRLSTEELIKARCQHVLRNEEALEEVVKRVMDSRIRDKARWDQVKNIRKEPLQLKKRMPAWARMKKESKGQLILVDVEVFKSRVRSLIDSGATRSYISRRALKKLRLGLKVEKLADPIISVLADNRTMRVEDYVEGVQAYFRLEKDGKVEKVLHSLNLLVQDDLPFDIVLGMDWGEAAGGTLHLREHECRLPSPSGEVNAARLFHVSRVDNTLAHCCLSAPAFARLVRKEQLEDQVFVVYVRPVTEPKEGDSSTDPTIAKLLEEFKDLTESSTGVVPRPIQHRIEIEPGSRTPKGAVYRMSPRELE
ncbi:hypothetical protein CBR_g3420 [Chara braunii]|uniref:Integrase catalytic domain-containing protein n=1 Tax=Chara braunii TaxID=69332 RepID=A0A388JQT2_CHABU|nr:hypothetical protein CBR_g3420 [Chara braunii]|eukprot:GBG60176.1 hypothetical protein CBR_g3420 [Chara braunii]